MTTENQQAPSQNAPEVLTPRQEHMLTVRDNIGGGYAPTAIVPRTFAEAQAFANALSYSSLVPDKLRDKSPDILVITLAGAELAFPPIRSLSLFHVMDGVPKLSADAIAALCAASPLCEYIEPRLQSGTRVEWAAKRRGRPEMVLAWTLDDAKAALLYPGRPDKYGNPGNWIKYTRNMLNARCKTDLCRMIFPDICAGLVSAEEAFDNAIDVEFREIPASKGFTAPPPSSAPPTLQAMATAAAGKPAETKAPAPGKSATKPAPAAQKPPIDVASTSAPSGSAPPSAASTPTTTPAASSEGAGSADPTPSSSAQPPSSRSEAAPANSAPAATSSASPTGAPSSPASEAGGSGGGDFGEAPAAPPALTFPMFLAELGAVKPGPSVEADLKRIRERWIPWSKVPNADGGGFDHAQDMRAAFAKVKAELGGA